MPEIKQIDPAGDRAKRIRRALGKSIKSSIETHGDAIAGYAIVTWDMRGNAQSSIYEGVGPVALALAPTYTHDALNRHVAVVLAADAREEALGA